MFDRKQPGGATILAMAQHPDGKQIALAQRWYVSTRHWLSYMTGRENKIAMGSLIQEKSFGVL